MYENCEIEWEFLGFFWEHSKNQRVRSWNTFQYSQRRILCETHSCHSLIGGMTLETIENKPELSKGEKTMVHTHNSFHNLSSLVRSLWCDIHAISLQERENVCGSFGRNTWTVTCFVFCLTRNIHKTVVEHANKLIQREWFNDWMTISGLFTQSFATFHWSDQWWLSQPIESSGSQWSLLRDYRPRTDQATPHF